MDTLWNRFKTAATLGQPDQVPVALIVDSPWLPGWAGIDTRDYFLYPEKWLEINKQLLTRFPDVTWIPGFWVEFGMAAEPSGFGAKMHFYPDRPPAIEPLHPDLAYWAAAKPANPLEDGLMPLALRLYRQMDERLSAEGTPIRMVAARGPLAVASWLTGIPGLMEGLVLQPEPVSKILETVTTTLIDWLQAQLDCLQHPEGILLLDDLVGMVSPRTYKSMVAPHLQRIFAAFDGLVRIYHNDTPANTSSPRWPRPGLTFSTSATKWTSPRSRPRWATGWPCWATSPRSTWACAAHPRRSMPRPKPAWTRPPPAVG